MTKRNTFETLALTAGIGFLSGIVGGFYVYFAIQSNAESHAQTLHPMNRASYLCAAGTASFLLGVLSVPAMTLFGLSLGAIFLARKRSVERRPLP